MKNTTTETLKEIKRRADFVLDTQGSDSVALRKAMINIANLAAAELNSWDLIR